MKFAHFRCLISKEKGRKSKPRADDQSKSMLLKTEKRESFATGGQGLERFPMSYDARGSDPSNLNNSNNRYVLSWLQLHSSYYHFLCVFVFRISHLLVFYSISQIFPLLVIKIVQKIWAYASLYRPEVYALVKRQMKFVCTVE